MLMADLTNYRFCCDGSAGYSGILLRELLMSFVSIAPLILLAAISTITPGGATALATASGLQFGFRRSVPLMAGIALGLAVLVAAVAAGLAGLFLAIPSFQLIMKVLGSVYLLWLAWKIGKSGAPDLKTVKAAPLSLAAGMGLLLLNPKAWAMAAGAAASFSMLSGQPLHLALLLGGVFGLASIVSLSLWCYAGMLFARLLKTPGQWRMLNRLLGLLLALSVIPLWRG